jgi:hypothetical protein
MSVEGKSIGHLKKPTERLIDLLTNIKVLRPLISLVENSVLLIHTSRSTFGSMKHLDIAKNAQLFFDRASRKRPLSFLRNKKVKSRIFLAKGLWKETLTFHKSLALALVGGVLKRNRATPN